MNVRSFYLNLSDPYNKEHYPLEKIWNYNEIGAQVGNTGGGLM